MQINQEKIELIKKIAQARLTPAELSAITAKATEIIDRRAQKPKPKSKNE